MLQTTDIRWNELVTGPLWKEWLDPEQVAGVMVRCQRALALPAERMRVLGPGQASYTCEDGKTYTVNTALGCTCKDAQYRAPGGWCKHRISLWLRQE